MAAQKTVAKGKAPAPKGAEKNSKFASLKSLVFGNKKPAVPKAQAAPKAAPKAASVKKSPVKAAPFKASAQAKTPNKSAPTKSVPSKATQKVAVKAALAPVKAAPAPVKGAAKPTPAAPVLTKAAKGKGGASAGTEVVKKGRGSKQTMSARARAEAAGESVCREVACENLATSGGYCRLHYIKNWKKIKRKELILREKKLNQYIEELVAKYPDKYIEAIRQDLASDKDFAKVIYDLDLDESVDEFDVENESIDSMIDNIKRDFDDDEGGF